MKLRSHLVRLVLATAVPLLLFAVMVVLLYAAGQRENIKRGAMATASALAIALDRELSGTIGALEVLATSQYLDVGELRGFFEQARRALEAQRDRWVTIVLADPSGQPRLNLLTPFGAPLPKEVATSEIATPWIREAAATGSPVVSNLFVGSVARRPFVSVLVPVVRDGTVRYVLLAHFESQTLWRRLRQESLPREWIGGIVDRNKVLIARTHESGRLVGRPATAVTTEEIGKASQGWFHGPMLDGQSRYGAFSRSSISGWTILLRMPTAELDGPVWRSVGMVVGVGALLTAIATIFAALVARRIVSPVESMLQFATGLGSSTLAHPPPPSTVDEVQRLGEALQASAVVLGQRDAAVRQEIEQRKRVEAALQEADRRKDEFLGTLSHELRTPLNAILGWVRMLRSGTLDAAAAPHALEVVERNVNHQSRLITDLLDISRIISGTLTLEVGVVELTAVVAGAVEAMRPTSEAKSLSLTTLLPDDALPIRGDAERLRQVVANLLSNAVKFTPNRGQVVVRLVRADDRARLIVSDTGTGISAEFLPYIFERFRQADSSSTRAHAGLGLGLAIVRHIVELHGGSVHAESAGEDKGATFTVDLPLAAPVATGAAGASGTSGMPGEPMSVKGVRVLIVDDDADSRELLTTVLAQHGAEPTAVKSVSDALATVRHLRPDALVCDIAMPGGDGFALIRQVRSWPTGEGGDVPALALTAYARPEDRDRALAAGFQLHLAKPVEPEELVEAVWRLDCRRRLGRDGP